MSGEARGWGITHRGKVLISSVRMTRRAALVNALLHYAGDDSRITIDTTDEELEKRWSNPHRSGGMELAEVLVTVIRPPDWIA